MGPEDKRLSDERTNGTPWKKWGPYLSERQWGTVREDYSQTGNAWNYFPHDQARSRAYRWGEDGLAGISDDKQSLCFALALWNGQDPILKERLFGLTNDEGNHGEDVKECYFYLDSTPTHSYMKYLYKYPQNAFPYSNLVETNRKRTRLDLEYELLDTGVFNDNRYFDVFVEYAKAEPEDVLIRITAWNRGPEPAVLHVLPTVWFRNTWSWSRDQKPRPSLRQTEPQSIAASHPTLGERRLSFERDAPVLFTENETNNRRIFNRPNDSRFVKDGINDAVVNRRQDVINPEATGTKAAIHYQVSIAPGEAQVFNLRLTSSAGGEKQMFGASFEQTLAARLEEADRFYADVIPPNLDEDARLVMRQAFAGMLWSKQFYYYPVNEWLHDDWLPPDCERRLVRRNEDWFHLESADVILMPDKWEYPWFAAWDLAFHCMVVARVDIDFAKEQLRLLTNQVYLHPNGQIPAYEWNFSDVNPPVHCKAVWDIYLMDRAYKGKADLAFLESQFHKLLMNFTWWVNRKDEAGRNVFAGGFLGLDNIGVFDRSAPLPTGGTIEQADGTSWMAMFCLDMLTIALELALHNPVYEDLACKFFEHFVHIAAAMDRIGDNEDELWDEQDGFFYDVLRLPRGGGALRLKVRSLVGLIPLFACSVLEADVLERLPAFAKRVDYFVDENARLLTNVNDVTKPGVAGRRMLAPVTEGKLRRILRHMLDESEFLSSYGIRSLSRHHRDSPYSFVVNGGVYKVSYEPAESSTGLFGGNSNWRGPIWMPVNKLLVHSLRRMYTYYGNDFTVECPTGSGVMMNLWQVADELARRLCTIFMRDDGQRRPVHGNASIYHSDPHWQNLALFYEYFHGDNGAGIGASHQTGWTGLVAWLFKSRAILDADDVLQKGYDAVAMKIVRSY